MTSASEWKIKLCQRGVTPNTAFADPFNGHTTPSFVDHKCCSIKSLVWWVICHNSVVVLWCCTTVWVVMILSQSVVLIPPPQSAVYLAGPQCTVPDSLPAQGVHQGDE